MQGLGAIPSVVLLAACSSVAWRPCVSEATWRGRSLREAEHASVAAHSEGGACEVYQLYERMIEAMQAVGIGVPERALLLAVEADDELLCRDGQTTLALLARWQPDADADLPQTPTDPTELALLDEIARVFAARPPLDAPELGLPAEWQQRFRWTFLLPSEACLDVVADRLIDAALDKEDVGFVQRLLLAPFLPMARSHIRKAWLTHNRRLLFSAALADRTDVPARLRDQCLAFMGLDPPAGSEPPTAADAAKGR